MKVEWGESPREQVTVKLQLREISQTHAGEGEEFLHTPGIGAGAAQPRVLQPVPQSVDGAGFFHRKTRKPFAKFRALRKAFSVLSIADTGKKSTHVFSFYEKTCLY
ncbi:MAG: hypothetical protein HFF17_05120 [Oscillospiraceae bacterium]|nr:hypothetical protein [Oscillospiraceae bacterium]